MELVDRDKIINTMVEFSHDGILFLDPGGRISQANPAACSMFGFDSVSDILQRSHKFTEFFDLYDFSDTLVPLEQWPFSRALNGASIIDFKCKASRKSTGKALFWLYSAVPVFDKAKRITGVVISIKDISDSLEVPQKITEPALWQYESYLSAILEATGDEILIVDNKGKVIKTNNLFSIHWKIPKSTNSAGASDETAMLVVAADQLVKPDAFIEKINRLSGSVEIDKDVVTFKDGRTVECFSAPVLHDESIIGRVWSFRDITKRVESERALLDNKEQLRLALMAGNHGFYVFDIPAGCAKVSPEYEAMLEYAPGETAGTLEWWTNSIHPEDRKRARSILDDCAYGKSQSYKMEFRMRTKSGGWKWILCQGKNVEYDKLGNPIRMLGTHTDITERKLAEIKLEERSRFIESIVNMTPDILYMYDVVDATNVYINNSAEKMLGYSKEEIQTLGNRIIPFLMHPDDLVRYQQTIFPKYATAKDNELIIHEHRMRHKSGEWRWLAWNETIYLRQSDGSPRQIFGLGRDITERKRVEETLREERNRLTKIAAAVPGVIYSYHPWPDGSATMPYASPAILTVLGFTPEEVAKDASPVFALIHSDDFKSVKESIAEAIRTQSSWHKEFRYNHPAKGEIWIEGHSVPQREADGTLLWQGFITDITDRKLSEEKLREEKNKLTKIAATLPGVIFSYRQRPDGSAHMPYASPAIFAVMGFSPKDVAKDLAPIFALIHPEDVGPVLESIAESGRTQSHWHKEFRYNHPAKGEVWIEAHSVPQLREADGSMIWHGFGADITERKKAEDALRESEEKFAKIFNRAPVLISISDTATGTFLDVNEKMLKLSGFSREEIIGHTSTEIGWISPEIRARILNEMQLHGRIDNVEMNLRAKDGHVIIGLVSCERISIFRRECLLFIWIDITERKQSEETRNRLTRDLRALSSCNQALMRAESEQALLDDICGIICDVSGYRMAWVGILPNEKSSYLKVVAQAGAGESLMTDAVYVLTDKEETPIDTALRGKTSSITPDFTNAPTGSLWSDYALKIGCRSAIALPLLDNSGNALGVLSICSSEPNVFAPDEIKLLEELAGDLSFGIMSLRARVERNLAQRALLYEKELSGALIEASPGIFCVMDRTGHFLRMNTNFMELQGLTRETFSSQEFLKYVYKDDCELSMRDLSRLPHIGHIEADIRFEFKPGVISWWSIYGHAVTIAETVYMIAAGFDITSRKHMEENLKKTLKDKDVLLQELYHRTKNNMQVISAYLALQAIVLNDEKLQSIFNEMENRIRAMALVHEKLYKSKDLTSISLQDYLNDLSSLLLASFSKVSGNVKLIFEAEEIFVTIDIAIPIGLVVTELLTNSLKYAFPDGRSGKILLRVKKHDQGEIALYISDNGIGIPESFDLAKLNSLGIPSVLSIVRLQLRGSVDLNTRNGFDWKILFRSDLYGKRV